MEFRTEAVRLQDLVAFFLMAMGREQLIQQAVIMWLTFRPFNIKVTGSTESGTS